MAGIVLGAAANHLPIIVDGFISAAAAALSFALQPNVRDYLFSVDIDRRNVDIAF